MIEEINDASSVLSKNNKEDDPVSPCPLSAIRFSPRSGCADVRVVALPDCPRTQWSLGTATADRSGRCDIAGEGSGGAEVEQEYGGCEWHEWVGE